MNEKESLDKIAELLRELDKLENQVEKLQKALEEVKSLFPLTQDEFESPSLRHNAGNMIMHKINEALERSNP